MAVPPVADEQVGARPVVETPGPVERLELPAVVACLDQRAHERLGRTVRPVREDLLSLAPGADLVGRRPRCAEREPHEQLECPVEPSLRRASEEPRQQRRCREHPGVDLPADVGDERRGVVAADSAVEHLAIGRRRDHRHEHVEATAPGRKLIESGLRQHLVDPSPRRLAKPADVRTQPAASGGVLGVEQSSLQSLPRRAAHERACRCSDDGLPGAQRLRLPGRVRRHAPDLERPGPDRSHRASQVMRASAAHATATRRTEPSAGWCGRRPHRTSRTRRGLPAPRDARGART